jgi:hypothetical protein
VFHYRDRVRVLSWRNRSEVNALHGHMIDTLDEQEDRMQKLVFTNYNKFISATSTIHSLKTDVETIDVRECEYDRH